MLPESRLYRRQRRRRRQPRRRLRHQRQRQLQRRPTDLWLGVRILQQGSALFLQTWKKGDLPATERFSYFSCRIIARIFRNFRTINRN